MSVAVNKEKQWTQKSKRVSASNPEYEDDDVQQEDVSRSTGGDSNGSPDHRVVDSSASRLTGDSSHPHVDQALSTHSVSGQEEVSTKIIDQDGSEVLSGIVEFVINPSRTLECPRPCTDLNETKSPEEYRTDGAYPSVAVAANPPDDRPNETQSVYDEGCSSDSG